MKVNYIWEYFPFYQTTAEVSGLHVRDVSLYTASGTYSYLSGIAAINEGSIIDCSVDVSFAKSIDVNFFGAIAAENEGHIERCVSTER